MPATTPKRHAKPTHMCVHRLLHDAFIVRYRDDVSKTCTSASSNRGTHCFLHHSSPKISLPSSLNLPSPAFTLSKVNIVVIAAGIALTIFVPNPL